MKRPRPGDKVRIAGLPVTIVSQEDAEKASSLVCTLATIPLMFPDNLTGPCSVCGRQVQWRPHSPKKPPRICLDCTMLREIRPAGNA